MRSQRNQYDIAVLGSIRDTKLIQNSPTVSIASEKYVMIVDDEQDILVLFRDYLQTKGFKVKTFQNPIEALTEFQFSPHIFSIIISDMRMPQMSGLRFIERVRKINREIKVIFMSAFDVEIKKIEQKNISNFLQKPISLEELFVAVSKVLESR